MKKLESKQGESKIENLKGVIKDLRTINQYLNSKCKRLTTEVKGHEKTVKEQKIINEMKSRELEEVRADVDVDLKAENNRLRTGLFGKLIGR